MDNMTSLLLYCLMIGFAVLSGVYHFEWICPILMWVCYEIGKNTIKSKR